MAKIDITGPQAIAAMRALESYLQAGTYEECLVIFGSPKGFEAAVNMNDKLRPVAVKHYKKTRHD